MRRNLVIEYFQITLGVILMTLGFYYFLLPMNLVIGGVMGLAVIFQKFINPSYFMYIVNIGLLVIGLWLLGKSFFVKTIFGTIASPTIVLILDLLGADQFFIINQFSDSKMLLASISGSILVGFGLGIVFRNNATTGGMDVLQTILHKKFHYPYNVVFYATDGAVILLGLLYFQNAENFIYGLAAIFITSYVISNVSIKGRAGQTMFIITKNPELIRDTIYEHIDRGVTIIDAQGGYSKEAKKMLVCTMSQRELNMMRELIEIVDQDAFTFMTQTKEAVGRGFSKD
ncbi:MAG: YitT family protein [Acholeplasmataceae bacterium]